MTICFPVVYDEEALSRPNLQSLALLNKEMGADGLNKRGDDELWVA